MAKAKKVVAAPKAVKKSVEKKPTTKKPVLKKVKTTNVEVTEKTKKVSEPLNSSLSVICKVISKDNNTTKLDVVTEISGNNEIIRIALVEGANQDDRLKEIILQSAGILIKNELTRRFTKEAKKTTKTKTTKK